MTGSVSAQKQQTLHSGYPIDPVPFTSVKVTDSFWGQRLKASREVTIPLAFSKCEETGRYENFVKATHPSDEYKVGGFSFDDTDVYKTIEGASYSLQTYPDKKLEEYIDSVLVIVAAAQEPDGYLYTARTMNPKHPHDWAGPERWSEVENLSHEFYNLGHMVEGAVAYYQATGKRNFLDIAIRYADCVCKNIGARHAGEAFGDNYELPNLTAYNETCAAIGNVYMNYRLFLLHGDSKYFDVLERTLYNGLISGVSLDGGKFFYPNPLSCDGKYHFNADHTITRQPWFGCACCPSNISRFIPSLPGYVYAVKDNQVYVNLFLSNRAELKLNEKKVVLEQETGYPWNGDIRVKVAQGNLPFTMNIRIPGWVRGSVLPSDLYSYADDLKLGYRVLVNGEEVTGELRKGYLRIDRKWKKGDVVEVHFDMQPRVVKANEKVVADRGRVAVERGPIVYCAEWADNDFNIQNIILNRHPKFQVTEKPELLYGINEITTEVQALGFDAAGKLATRDVTLTLIPYYAWAHRGEGKMDVWLPVNRIDVE